MNAIYLLKLALALLIAAQGANVTPELRQEAVLTANTAIEYANTQLNASAATPEPQGLYIASSSPEATPEDVLKPRFGCPDGEKLPEDGGMSVGYAKCN